MRYARIGLLAAIVAALPVAAAMAGIKFCNKTEHTTFAAIAYQEGDGSWTSEGWLEVAPGKCERFDLSKRISQFYYRGETDWYDTGNGNKEMATWGSGDVKFAIINDDFTFHHAEQSHNNARMESFSASFESSGGDISETITFNPDDTTTQSTGD